MDAINTWFDSQASTPMGSLLLFLLVFILRYSLARLAERQRQKRATKPPKGSANAA